MPVLYTSGELQFSGAVTNAEFSGATSTAGLSVTGNIYRLEAPVRFLSGCDLSDWKNFVIDVNAQKFNADAGVIETTLAQMTLIDRTGRSVANRFWYLDAGGGFLKLKNSQYISSVSGGTSSGTGRLLDIVSVDSIENSTIKAHHDALLEPDINFKAQVRYRGLNAYRVSRFIIQETCMIQDATHFSISNNGGYIDGQSGSSLILLNWNVTRTLNRDFDSYPSGSTSGQVIFWLGTSRERFFRSPPTRNGLYLGVNTSDNTFHYVGGIRWLNFIGGSNGKFGYYNNSQSTAVNSNINLSIPALSDTGFIDLDFEGNVEFMTREFLYRKTSGFTDYTDHKIVVRKFGKEVITQDITSTVSEVIGSDSAYAPVLMIDLPYIDVLESVITAYTEAETSKKFAQLAHVWSISQDRADVEFSNNLVSYDGSLNVNVGPSNVIIDASAASAFDYSGTTITINANVYTGGIVTSGNVTLANGSSLGEGSIITGDLNINNGSADTILTFDNVTITGDITNTGTGTLTINLINGASGTTSEPGTTSGLVDIKNPVDVIVTVLDASDSSTLSSARVYLEAASGGPLTAGTEIINTVTNGSGVVELIGFNFISDQPVTGRVGKGTTSPFYKTSSISGVISSSGVSISTFLVRDE